MPSTYLMHPETIYTKTAKGVLEVKNKSIRLPRDLGLVFLAVDGKCKAGGLAGKSGIQDGAVAIAIEKLIGDGYVRVFIEGAPAGGAERDDGVDLDFTSPAKVAELNQEAEHRARAEVEAKTRADQAARAAGEAKARQEVEAR